ncbi:MAG: thioredoxin fold domain-containing protein [Saprospiraceae bacterium]
MHYKFSFLIFLFLWVNVNIEAQNRIRWVKPSISNDIKTDAEKYYLIYFYYNDCKWCKHIETTTFTDNYTARFINQKFHPIKINAVGDEKLIFNNEVYKTVQVGKYDFNELAVELLNGKMSFPAIVILDQNFQKIGVHQNYYNVDDFQMILAYYIGGHYKKTLFKYYSNNYCKDSHFYNLVSDR